MSIAKNIHQIKLGLPDSVTLIVVTKTQPIEKLLEVYDAGHKIFGENKVQEILEKKNQLPIDVDWHLIGHLQTNKVKYIAPFIKLIHSVDSLKLLQEINKQAQKNNRIIDCLLQIYIANEETKFGLTLQEAINLINSKEFKSCKNINIVGVMGMASFVEDDAQIRTEFRRLKSIFVDLQKKYFSNKPDFKEISMGMR